MSTATIVLEDIDGQIACKLTFSSAEKGGYDPKSHAHQHAQILIKLMDQMLENKGPLPAEMQTPPLAVSKPRILLGQNG